MLVRCKKTVDGITIGRFYEFKWYTGNDSMVIVNNKFQLVAYPTHYFQFLKDSKSKEQMHDNLRSMLKSKTFFTV
jgi:hypothetical protein